MSALIRTNNFFKSNLTDKIDDFIRMTKPTSDNPVDSWKVARAVLQEQNLDYKAVQPIRSYLNSLAQKNLLRAYGADNALEVQPRQYWIHEPHQVSYWSK